MSYRMVMSGALALGCVIGLQAQAPSTRTNRTAPGEITLNGCVERADQVAAAATAGTTVDSLSFVLIHAVKGMAADSPTVGTTGTKEVAKDDSKTTMYRLDADMSKLNPHVGHKVEVTGTLDAAAPTAGSADPSSAETAPILKVGQVKMLSETCDR